MKIKPLGDRVLVKPNKTESKTKGGIYIPDSAKEKKNQGEVIAIGNGKKIKEDVKVGDRILYKEYGGAEVKVDDTEYMLLELNDILGIIE